jgi:hypothetical protein
MWLFWLFIIQSNDMKKRDLFAGVDNTLIYRVDNTLIYREVSLSLEK